MSEIKLEAQLRKKGEKLKKDYIPAVLYGPNIENQILAIKLIEFEKAYRSAGYSSLVTLVIDGKETKTLIKDLQVDPVRDHVMHVDFYGVDMDKKVVVSIPLKFIDESPAVREKGGFLVRSKESVTVECLPGRLVPAIEVDQAKLVEFKDAIKLEDLDLAEGMKLVSKTNDVVIIAKAPRKALKGEEKKEEKKSGAVSEKKKEEKKDDKK